MLRKLYAQRKALWSIKKEYRLKVFLLSLTFLLMSACLVIWKPLKYSIFAKMVGPTYVPIAKLYSLTFLIPLILLYSKLVDWLRRHHLLYCFTIAHGIGGLILYYFLSHPVYGVANTQVSTSRYVGWAFYFFMESFDAFFSTTFWSFADSVNNPKDAKNYYGFFVSGSKIGGILSAGALYIILNLLSVSNQALFLPRAFLFGSFMLFAAAISLYFLVKKVPENVMHGYEAVYQLEKHKPKEKMGFIESLKSAFDGLFIMVRNPYVLGIFSLVVFYEIIVAIFDYLVVLQANVSNPTIGSMTAFYALYYFIFNLIGLVISTLGTTPILRILGIRLSLFIFPCLCMVMLLITLLFPITWVLFWALIGLRAFNYALNHPTKEVLYIPTTKAIKFKAKTWTDAFGSRIAKSFGSIFNMSLKGMSHTFALFSSIIASLGLTSCWLVIIYFLGKKLQTAIDNKQIIGDTSSSKPPRTTNTPEKCTLNV